MLAFESRSDDLVNGLTLIRVVSLFLSISMKVIRRGGG